MTEFCSQCGQPLPITTREVSLGDILETVARVFGVSRNDLIGRGRKVPKQYVARAVAMWFARKLLRFSHPLSATAFGAADHTASIYACQRIDDELQKNEALRVDVARVFDRLGCPADLPPKLGSPTPHLNGQGVA